MHRKLHQSFSPLSRSVNQSLHCSRLMEKCFPTSTADQQINIYLPLVTVSTFTPGFCGFIICTNQRNIQTYLQGAFSQACCQSACSVLSRCPSHSWFILSDLIISQLLRGANGPGLFSSHRTHEHIQQDFLSDHVLTENIGFGS